MSERFDCNDFIGEWPFRRFYHGGMEGLQKVWEQAGITAGAVSTLNSVFYNDPMEAEELLDGIPANRRDGEWYFLKGTIFFKRGWLDDAMNNFTIACRMNPNNPEYRAALNRMMWQQQGNMGSPNGAYRTGGNVGGASACDCCSSLLCADCCCECMGGDLIGCC